MSTNTKNTSQNPMEHFNITVAAYYHKLLHLATPHDLTRNKQFFPHLVFQQKNKS